MAGYEVRWKVKKRRYGNRTLPSRNETSIFKRKSGKFGTEGFKKHLKEVYGRDLISFKVKAKRKKK